MLARSVRVFQSRSHTLRLFSNFPDHIKLSMPALSPTMEKGNLARWLKKEGDKIKPGEAMADVETDKATVAWEAVEEGYLAKILLPAGTQDVPVGKVAAILAENETDVPKFKDFSLDGAASSAAAAPSAGAAAASTPSTPAATTAAAPAAPANSGRVLASPVARRLAAEKGIDLAAVEGTGPNRRIVKADVLEYKGGAQVRATPAAAATPVSAPVASVAPVAPAAPAVAPPAPAGAFTDIPHTNVRKVIAARLTQSKQQIPHYYLSVDVRVDKLLSVRKHLNEKQGEKGTKISVNDFVIKACALALRKVPEANSSWLDNATRLYNYVDVSVAVSTDTGLITPIVKDADRKGLGAIASDVKSLAAKARENKLQPHEFQGGTFTVSNLGMFGVKNFSAIINPPQACILAVGGTEARVVPSEKKDGEKFEVGNFMSVTLSSDHRVVDGAVGALWLAAFKGYIEDPLSLLI